MLVCGARQMMHFGGQASVTSEVHPMRLYKIHLQNLLAIGLQGVDLVHDLAHLGREFFAQVLVVGTGGDARLGVRHA